MPRTPRRTPLALAAALLLASTVAIAGPGGPGGPKGGPGGPGMGGPAMSGGMVEHAIDGLKDKLALDGAQQTMFDTARAQSLAARDRMHASRTDVRTKVQAELAKPEPDLAAVSAMLDGAEEQGRSLRRQSRDQWLKVYASLRPDQKAIVRDEIKSRMARMDGMQERMKERRAHGTS